MNRFIIILFTIFIFFTSFVKSIPSALQKREDPLSGFKQCKGKFPNVITAYDYSPDPIVYTKPVKVLIAGNAAVGVEQGALMTATGYYKDRIAYLYGIDYCKVFVKQSGYKSQKEKEVLVIPQSGRCQFLIMILKILQLNLYCFNK